MKPFRLDPGAALLLGLLLFALRPEELAAVVTAALIHELGHVLALWRNALRRRQESFELLPSLRREKERGLK